MAKSVVAVAGGSASIGRSIVEEIKEDGEFEVIVLSRKADPELEGILGVRIHTIDYSNPEEIASLLEEHGVFIVVSAIGDFAGPENEYALIQASWKSNVTKRYIPSIWGIKYLPEHAFFQSAKDKMSYLDALEKTDLEWTAVALGSYLDYWGMPKIKSYLSPFTPFLDIAGKKAAIPGTRNLPNVFTYSQDVARFTAKLLTLERWDRTSYIIGDKLTWEEFVSLSEDVTGVKFDVTYDSLEMLRSGKILCDMGAFDLKPTQTLNDLFPGIKLKSAREVVEIGWKN